MRIKKYIWFILVISVISITINSCLYKKLKYVINTDHKVYDRYDYDTVYNLPRVYDEIYLEERVGSPLPDRIYDESMNLGGDYIRESDNKISEGKIAHSFPDTMKCFVPERGVLRITKIEHDTILVERTNPRHGEFVIINKIRVSNVMSSELIDASKDSSFIIKPLSSEVQNIEEKGYTQWEWMITPTKSGSKTLRLSIKVLQSENGSVMTKDIPVFEEDIHVVTNTKESIIEFFKKYWQWLISVLFIPFLKYLYGLFIKKEKE